MFSGTEWNCCLWVSNTAVSSVSTQICAGAQQLWDKYPQSSMLLMGLFREYLGATRPEQRGPRGIGPSLSQEGGGRPSTVPARLLYI